MSDENEMSKDDEVMLALNQAPMTASDYMTKAVAAIDRTFGKGYAERHPVLVAGIVSATSQDFHSTMISMLTEVISRRLQEVSAAIESVGRR